MIDRDIRDAEKGIIGIPRDADDGGLSDPWEFKKGIIGRLGILGIPTRECREPGDLYGCQKRLNRKPNTRAKGHRKGFLQGLPRAFPRRDSLGIPYLGWIS